MEFINTSNNPISIAIIYIGYSIGEKSRRRRKFEEIVIRI